MLEKNRQKSLEKYQSDTKVYVMQGNNMINQGL